MADITLCSNSQGCPQRLSCVRVSAEPSRWQSYANFFDPTSDQDCSYFVEHECDKTI